MNEVTKAIFFAVLGAILAGLAQWGASSVLAISKRKSNVSNYRLVVRVELDSVLKQLEKLKNTFNDKGYYAFASLNSLDSRIKRLEQNIGEVHKAGKNAQIQSKFVTTVTDLSDLTQDLLNLENYSVNEINKSNQNEVAIKQAKMKPTDAKKALEQNTKTAETTRSFVDQQRTARLVELVDVSRKVETLIETFRDKIK